MPPVPAVATASGMEPGHRRSLVPGGHDPTSTPPRLPLETFLMPIMPSKSSPCRCRAGGHRGRSRKGFEGSSRSPGDDGHDLGAGEFWSWCRPLAPGDHDLASIPSPLPPPAAVIAAVPSKSSPCRCRAAGIRVARGRQLKGHRGRLGDEDERHGDVVWLESETGQPGKPSRKTRKPVPYSGGSWWSWSRLFLPVDEPGTPSQSRSNLASPSRSIHSAICPEKIGWSGRLPRTTPRQSLAIAVHPVASRIAGVIVMMGQRNRHGGHRWQLEPSSPALPESSTVYAT